MEVVITPQLQTRPCICSAQSLHQQYKERRGYKPQLCLRSVCKTLFLRLKSQFALQILGNCHVWEHQQPAANQFSLSGLLHNQTVEYSQDTFIVMKCHESASYRQFLFCRSLEGRKMCLRLSFYNRAIHSYLTLLLASNKNDRM